MPPKELIKLKNQRKRVFLIVLDSAGIGALPDWKHYDDEPGNTIPHIAAAVGGLTMPNCQKLGLGNICEIQGIPPTASPRGAYGKAPLTTCGKDTTAGHWEMMGIILKKQFPTFPKGFPADFVKKLEAAFGHEILCNRPYSGTQVIEDYGEEHYATKKPIVYTSGDSVLQIACHEDIYSTRELYALCEKARTLCAGPYGVGRVIARPFTGTPHQYKRTEYRKDFSIQPPKQNYLTALREKSVLTWGVGKINDIFAGEGLEKSTPVKGNSLCIEETIRLLRTEKEGFFFINLVDFDMLYGHRNDAKGYGKALVDFDCALNTIFPLLTPEDLLIITADHGNDPTTAGTDHNREYVPLLVKGAKPENLGIRKTMADIGATVYHALTGETRSDIPGESIL